MDEIIEHYALKSKRNSSYQLYINHYSVDFQGKMTFKNKSYKNNKVLPIKKQLNT